MTNAEPVTAVIIAGAVARGAYEAAALAELLPRVLPEGLRNTFFLGTSSGAINAALWARFASTGRSTAQIGSDVVDVWRSINDLSIFGSVPKSLSSDLWGALRGLVTGDGLSSLVDTKPLQRTVAEKLHADDVARNIAERRLIGAGIAATYCSDKIAGARTHLFWHSDQKPVPARTGTDTGIDYIPARINPEHILASAAVPALFPPVAVGTRYYIDGGVRLNTPIAPALALGANRVIVVSSHTAKYTPLDARSHSPQIGDAIAQVLHSVLADSTIEDLRRLQARNNAVKQQAGVDVFSRSGRVYKEVPYIVVAPKAGELAAGARDALRSSSYWSARARRYRSLYKGLAALGAGPGRDELLSYLFFDPAYFEKQFKLGQENAASAGSWRLQGVP